MPFYEYECQSCKFYTEVMQKISDPPLVKCPSCGKRTMQKLMSAPVFRLKGSGWYETDFKSDKEDKRNLAVEREEPKPAAEDAKPDAKAPAAETEKPAKAAEPKTPSVDERRGAGASSRAGSAAQARRGRQGGRAAPLRRDPRRSPRPAPKRPGEAPSGEALSTSAVR